MGILVVQPIEQGMIDVLNEQEGLFTLFLNGIGKIKIQFYIGLVWALLFIPITFLFYKLGFGLSSLVIPNIIIGLIKGLLFTYQYKKIICKTATGVWIK